MKTKTVLTILILIFSLSIFSCADKNDKVAVMAFSRGQGVPANIASMARKIVTDTIIKRNTFNVLSTDIIDEVCAKSDLNETSSVSDLLNVARAMNAGIMIIGNIKLDESSKKARYTVDVSCIDTNKNTFTSSFTETFNENLKNMNKEVKKLKLTGK